MSDVAIKVENLGKRYRIGQREKYQTLRESMTRLVTSPWRRLRDLAGGFGSDADSIWALKDVCLDIDDGEVVGVIGRNGAGKSTFLKILSRITDPSVGQVTLTGRVGSLLEVGTGFHPELTGRENVYLNGVILGMRRHEIKRKFDEIVAFAEIEQFLDTPVKRYSSGMYMRLAFAVAAHLEPDILLVDEVLAVGDAAFQVKCMGKMRSVAREGRTVLFVSHNMASIQHLCKQAVLFRGGKIASIGEPGRVIGEYMSDAAQSASVDLTEWKDRRSTDEARLMGLSISDGEGRPTTTIPLGGSVCITMDAQFNESMPSPTFGVIMHNALGEAILDLRSPHDGFEMGRVKGHVQVKMRVDGIGLYPGRYVLSPWISDSAVRRDVDYVKQCCTIDVIPAPGPHGDLKLDPTYGKYHLQSQWSSVNGNGKTTHSNGEERHDAVCRSL